MEMHLKFLHAKLSLSKEVTTTSQPGLGKKITKKFNGI